MRIVRLRKVHVDAAAAVLDRTYFHDLEKARAWIRAEPSKKRPLRWLVALKGDEVVGLLGYQQDYSHHANYVSDLAVKKGHRREGTGTALLRRFVEECRKEQPTKQRYCLSSTQVSNRASIRLHQESGFKEMGILKGLHYGQDEMFFGYRL
ncbi:MAG: GNAT family N-acetyltransferase [DPANN group archaeon]|nr:GNAT family N-acetyltransferase [DPANN group archaeon]